MRQVQRPAAIDRVHYRMLATPSSRFASDASARLPPGGRILHPALVEQARRHGNHGWHVGRAIVVVPHLRAASPAALSWTGEGRKIPKIRFRRGTVVHRTKLVDPPTGFLEKKGDDGGL